MLCINWNDNFLHACKVHTSDPDRAVRLVVPALNGSSICDLDDVGRDCLVGMEPMIKKATAMKRKQHHIAICKPFRNPQ